VPAPFGRGRALVVSGSLLFLAASCSTGGGRPAATASADPAAARKAASRLALETAAVEMERGTPAGARHAICLLDDALANDPRLAPAHAALALAWASLAFEWRERGLDNEREWAAATDEIRRAELVSPGPATENARALVEASRQTVRPSEMAAILRQGRGAENPKDALDRVRAAAVGVDRTENGVRVLLKVTEQGGGDDEATLLLWRFQTPGDPIRLDGSRLHPDGALSTVEAFDVGHALFLQGRGVLARPWLERTVSLEPRHGRALADLGTLALRKGDPSTARALFQQSVDVDPEIPEARLHLGALLFDDGQSAEARRQWDALLRLTPDDEQALYNLGILEAEDERWNESRALFEELVELGGRLETQALTQGCVVLVRQDQRRLAANRCQEAMAATGPGGVAELMLGLLDARSGNWKDACPRFLSVVRTDPSLAESHRSEAECLVREGRTDAAVDELRTAMRLLSREIADLTARPGGPSSGPPGKLNRARRLASRLCARFREASRRESEISGAREADLPAACPDLPPAPVRLP
jgi:Tfp pilus assembly protein PilF